MGNIEKLVVLTVLFLSAIVLAVSLNEDGEASADGGTPLAAATERLREASPAQPAGQESPGLLLDAGASGQGGNGAAAPGGTGPLEPRGKAAQGARVALLKSEEGLTASGLDDYRIYRVEQDGEAWTELCQRFYGDQAHLHLLRTANEELEELRAGDRLLVPVYDLEREAGTRDPYRPVERRGDPDDTGDTGDTGVAGVADEKGQAEDARPGGTYLVRDGDNLSRIAKAVYGSASRWEDIYDANKDVLADPDTLDVGVRLKLPK